MHPQAHTLAPIPVTHSRDKDSGAYMHLHLSWQHASCPVLALVHRHGHTWALQEQLHSIAHDEVKQLLVSALYLASVNEATAMSGPGSRRTQPNVHLR